MPKGMTEKDLDDEGRRGLRWVEDHDIGAVGIYISVGALLAELEALRPVVEAAVTVWCAIGDLEFEKAAEHREDLRKATRAYMQWKQERENG